MIIKNKLLNFLHKLEIELRFLGEMKLNIISYIDVREEQRQISIIKLPTRSTYLRSLISKLLLVSLLISNTSYAAIITTYSINSITVKEILEKIDESSLVLINIDDTIITPKSQMFRYNSSYRTFLDDLSSLVSYRPNVNQIIAQLLMQRQMMLIEANWPDFINRLKNKGALVFGFTRKHPACSLIKNFEEWQYNQLHQFNINFTDKVNDKEIFNFDSTNKNSSTFYKGIIFTNLLNKAQALSDFMNISNIAPLKIIIFENKKSELKDIDYFLSTVDLDYYGIEYLAFKEITSTLDNQIIKFQQETLIKTSKWLEDDDAQQFLRTTKNRLVN